LAVQARTLELYRQLDLTKAVVARGHRVPAVNLWVKGEAAARLPFESVGSSLTPYPFLHIFPQDQHERLLIERLLDLGIAVERQTELVSFTNGETASRLACARLAARRLTARRNYIYGCDGHAQTVREAIGTGFPGGTYRQIFYVADVEAAGSAINGELHVDLDEADFLWRVPVGGSRKSAPDRNGTRRASRPGAIR